MESYEHSPTGKILKRQFAPPTLPQSEPVPVRKVGSKRKISLPASALLSAATLGFVCYPTLSPLFKVASASASKSTVGEPQLELIPLTPYRLPEANYESEYVRGRLHASLNQPKLEDLFIEEKFREEKQVSTIKAPTKTQQVVQKKPSNRAVFGKVLTVIQKYAPKHPAPTELTSRIVEESREQGYDPLFVAAVIKSESAFNTMAKSSVGAQGLMQIMPKTGNWLADKEEMQRGKLTDPGYNLKLGIKYLKHLEQLYNGNRVFVLIAYNWGPGRVDSATGGERRVPTEVMGYAVKILNDFRRWSSEV